MDFLDDVIKNELDLFLNAENHFKLITIWGEQGTGKTFAVNTCLKINHIKVKDIIFSSESVFPTNSIEGGLLHAMDEDSRLIGYSNLFREGYCLLLQNMEYCDSDSKQLFYRLLKYHKNNAQTACVILEYNSIQKPNDILCSLSDNVLYIAKPEKSYFYSYLNSYFETEHKNAELFDKIIELSECNIRNFFAILNVLEHLGVISQNNAGLYRCHEMQYKMPNSLLDLYIDLFETLKDYTRTPLISAAPFSSRIYSTIIREIYHNYTRYEEYLSALSKQNSFISDNQLNEYNNSEIFQAPYVFSTKSARDAVMAKINTDSIYEITSRYYNYLDNLYNNKQIYNHLKDEDKILLLTNLTKNCQGSFRINQISYIVELMQYFYKHFMYRNAIKQGECLLNGKFVSNKQLNTEAHQFWLVFFKSLLSVGDYKKLIGYKEEFEDDDLNLLIAVALYNYGSPSEAMIILQNKLSTTQNYKGNMYNLMASIYDWLGCNKESSKCFKKALKYSSDDAIKYQLYKKYSMYVDFRIPECQQKLKEAIAYYKPLNIKQYAECLHNCGTGYVMIQDFSAALENLELSISTLNKICANEIYYPLNSLGILYCYNGRNYKSAIDVWTNALKCDIDVKFCKLALHNNRFNAYINLGDLDSARTEKNILFTMFTKECDDLDHISEKKPDIQHQLRQFFYNCGLLYSSENALKKALYYFVKARNCSTYNSVVLYSINQNIERLKDKLGKKTILSNLKSKKIPEPTEMEKFVHESNMYLCEIMFWG